MQLFDAEYRKDIPNVVRWYTTLVHFPHFDAVFVEKNLCKQRLKCEFLQALSLKDCAPHNAERGGLVISAKVCHRWLMLSYGLGDCDLKPPCEYAFMGTCIFLHRCLQLPKTQKAGSLWGVIELGSPYCMHILHKWPALAAFVTVLTWHCQCYC